ncbi:2Fe-2S iron-sulfur cluster-binding protein [Paenibacillus aquistagni]|uniref:2Fe-2S iron-sulfur cluster binding domain-containing protein n=1 Tax=Paenibacillus aquistagni TaxID=1852522 RepID=A0A1X7JH51_9BACL|nr:2Fe-2S iron-sulfur cluster-binding protein [Paenibacillus aquistagni]NMM54118.1 (2Fe-2S)-binding protein [Paenibacillus aquistagni]SMG27095.1 2Fe-2S iron-sulfur cluster binding domain-containing protein [Paenibacillus aquistagni]
MTRIRFMPDDKWVTARGGQSVLDAARLARVPIRTRCQGRAACLMCKVHIEGEGIEPPSKQERLKLGVQEKNGLRLACQARVGRDSGADITVSVPEDRLKAIIRQKLLEQEDDSLW